MLVCNYDNCAYSGKERAPLASDPHNPNMVICGCTNGKGWIMFDLRKQQPALFSLNVHTSVMRDITYLDESWPFGHQNTAASVSLDGVCKIRSFDDKEVHSIDVGFRSNCIAASPDCFYMSDDHGLKGSLMIGGDGLSGYMAELESKVINFGLYEKPIQKLKYTSNGHFLYTASSDGQVYKFRRLDGELQFLSEVYSHRDEIVDMDISTTDEFIVTASRDGTVGLMCLGVPSYGWTGFMQLA